MNDTTITDPCGIKTEGIMFFKVKNRQFIPSKLHLRFRGKTTTFVGQLFIYTKHRFQKDDTSTK